MLAVRRAASCSTWIRASVRTHGEQENSVWNGHYSCTCYHPVFVFNQFGDLERCSLRPGNVHSADGWGGVLKPVVERYQGKVARIYFRSDAGFANPDVYEFLEAERIKYAIRLPANRILQERIGHLLTRPIGRPPNEVRRSYVNFTYQAGSWTKSRRVVAKVEWHPRVPVADNIPGAEMPMFRDLWQHIRSNMPKKGRGKANTLDPLSLPPQLQTALEALYGHYEKTYELWQKAGIRVPPCFIVVCNNTSTSKLVYDFISGFQRQNDDGSTTPVNGRLPLFRNFDEHGNPFARPNTLLIHRQSQRCNGESKVGRTTTSAVRRLLIELLKKISIETETTQRVDPPNWPCLPTVFMTSRRRVTSSSSLPF